MSEMRLKFVAGMIAGQSPPSKDVYPLSEGQPFLQGKAEFGKSNPTPRFQCDIASKQSQPGDILVSVRAPVGAINVSDQAYGIGRGLAAVRAEYIDPDYMCWVLESSEAYLRSESNGSTFEAITTWDIGEIRVHHNDFQTQRSIADYLDRETGEIDAMIDKLGELDETLRARRIDAITRSITSDTTIAIGLMVDVKLGKMLQPAQKRETDVLKPYLRAAHIQPGDVLDREVETKEMWFSKAEAQSLDLCAGDTVVVEGGAGLGRSAYLKDDLPGWGFQNSIIRLRGHAHDGRYLMYSLHAALESGAIHVACNAATFAHFTAEKVEGFRVPYHEPEERKRIADHLDEVTSKIDTMLAKVAQLKDLLIERRAALIIDVVTGRKDVA